MSVELIAINGDGGPQLEEICINPSSLDFVHRMLYAASAGYQMYAESLPKRRLTGDFLESVPIDVEEELQFTERGAYAGSLSGCVKKHIDTTPRTPLILHGNTQEIYGIIVTGLLFLAEIKIPLGLDINKGMNMPILPRILRNRYLNHIVYKPPLTDDEYINSWIPASRQNARVLEF